MNKKGGGRSLLFAVFLFALMLFIGVNKAGNTFAIIGTGQGFDPGGTCDVSLNVSNGVILGPKYTNNTWHIDTCYGLSWLYYKWPTTTNSSGEEIPINSNIQFLCTDTTCPKTGLGYSNEVSKECGKPENGGGFWYLGYEVYGSAYSSDSGKRYDIKSGSGARTKHSYGFNMGSPSVGYLKQWLRDDGIGARTGVETGLYPFTLLGTSLLNEDFFSENENLNLNGYMKYISSDEIKSKGYTPSKCSEYSYNCMALIGIKKSDGTYYNGGFPRIKNGSSYQAVNAEYYGSTKEVYKQWKALKPEQRITSTNIALSESDFKMVNWFCSGNTGNITARSGVKTNQSTNEEYSAWVDSDNSTASVDYSSSAISVTDKIVVTFTHYLKGKGQTEANITNNQSSLKTNDANGKNWADKKWNYDSDSNTKVTPYTRTRTVTSAELQAISDGETNICDTLSFGAQSSTACIKLIPKTNISQDDVGSYSSVKKHGTEAWTNDNKSDGQAEYVTISVPVANEPASVDIDFQHVITAIGSGTANVTWVVSQDASSSIRATSHSANGVEYINITTTGGFNKPVDTSVITVSGILANTDATVCQSLKTTYGTERTTTVCARVVGTSFMSSSSVKESNDSNWTTTSTDGQTANRGTITKTVIPGEPGSVNLKFIHKVGMTSGMAGSGSLDSMRINYTVSQSPNNSNGVSAFTTVSDHKDVTVSALVPNPQPTVSETTITVSGITKDTNVTVCQTLTASYNGKNRTTKACATVKGSANVVKGMSSVGSTSGASDESTGFIIGSATAQPGSAYTVYMPYKGSSSKTIYFKHALKGEKASGAENLGSVTYSVLRDSNYLSNDYKNKSIGFDRISGTEWSAYSGSVDISANTTLCQTLDFSYGNTGGTPKACAEVVGVQPTVKGSSTISAGGQPLTETDNNETTSLNDIEVKMALGKTATANVKFNHHVIAETKELDAKGKSTGNIPYEIKNQDGATRANSTWSGNFPNSFTDGKLTVSGSPRGETTETVIVGPVTISNQTTSKKVCETLFVDTNAYKTTVCATVVGKLSLPTIKSRSGVSAKNSNSESDYTFTEWNSGSSGTYEVTRESKIVQAVSESQSLNGGINVPVYFRHDIRTTLGELAEQLTGEVQYEIITTGATNNTTVTDKFNHTVKTLTPDQTEILPQMRYVNVKCDYSNPDNIVCTDTTVCQELRFTFNGILYSTKACAKVKAITADPLGTSKASVKGYSALADTEYVDGAIKEINIDVAGRTIKGSDIVFDHGLSIAGEQVIESLGYYIDNDCEVGYDNGGCENNYSASGHTRYEGGSNTSRAVYWLYRKLDSQGHPTNIYQRKTAITDKDAARMVERGRVCESLSFYYDNVWHRSTVCINFIDNSKDICEDVTGNITNTGGTTSSKSYVRKYLNGSNTSPTPNKTQTIYAKPTDSIVFTHCYYPGAQATRYTDYDESEYNKPENNGKIVRIPMRNAFVETVNEFTIANKNGTDGYVNNSNKFTFNNYDQKMRSSSQDDGRVTKFTGVAGNANKTSIESSATNIKTDAVGGTIRQSLFDHPGTNSVVGHNTANCGSGCLVTYRNDGDNKWYNIASRTTDKAVSESSYAEVIVPYNYTTTASIDTGNGYVYAGEAMSGKQVSIIVNKRQNNTVQDNYATKTAESSVRLFMFYSTNGNQSEGSDTQLNGSNPNICSHYKSTLGFSNCVELEAEKSTTGLIFNKDSALNGSAEPLDAFKNSYNVPDIVAGSKVCMGVSVYPAASTDTEPSNGKTYVSKAYCRIVAKKPSFQIWGGSLYSSGNVSARMSTKYVIDSVYNFSPIRQAGDPSITFGSWVEQSIIANGLVSGVSSGAGTGYGQANLAVDASHPGGSSSNNYCNLSRLSFSNVNCATGLVGQFGLSGDSTTEGEYKQRYANKAATKDIDRNSNVNNYTSVNLSSDYTEEDGIRYTYASGSLAISASQRLGQGITHVVYVKGNVVIRGSSLLYNDGGYQRLNQVPQYIVFAEGNIYIEPSVTRVDAILIAGKNVNTCAKLSGGSIVEAKKASDDRVTDLYCNKQLKINGIVIADTLKLYRIYGASTGLNSITPAEIIDYSPNVYFWGSNESTSSSKGVYTTYQRELAPRQ